MKEHANVSREAFDIRWGGHRIASIGGGPARETFFPIALASFTVGANWALNFDRFRELAPQVDPEVVQSLLLDA